MKAADANLRFPVLGFTTDQDIWGFPTLHVLSRCGRRTLKDGMQIGMELVDLEGRRFVVRSFKSGGRDRALLPWMLWSMLAGSQYWIEQELHPLQPLSLEEVKARVCAGIRAHPSYWCEEADRDAVLPERIAEVQSVISISEIHSILGLDDFRAY